MRWLSLLVAVAACNTPRTPEVVTGTGIHWIEDDYPRALAEARRTGKPLVVDAWAPWCHTCISMTSFVFTDRSLDAMAGRFVWVSVDTEKAANAPVLAKLPVSAWPTYFVLDARDETVKGRWTGSATIGQLRTWLGESERAVRAGHNGPLAEADAAALAKDWRRAAELYARVEPRPEILVSRIEALWKAADVDACVAFAREAMDKTGNTQSAIDFASYAVSCAEKKDDVELRRLAEARLSQVVADPNALIAADDRGAAYETLRELREQLGDKAGARRAAEDLLVELGAAAKAAPDAHAASTFNFARAMAFLYLGRGDEAIAMLDASEKALPEDYNPPHQLARVYRELGRLDDALAALDRALPKSYGPRKGGFLGLKAELLEKKGDLAAAGQAYQAQIAHYESLPPEQHPAERVAKAREGAARCRKRPPSPAL
jgi:thioredoxin-like negative regulator of GroEL